MCFIRIQGLKDAMDLGLDKTSWRVFIDINVYEKYILCVVYLGITGTDPDHQKIIDHPQVNLIECVVLAV